jgi:hypothetical protein
MSKESLRKLVFKSKGKVKLIYLKKLAPFLDKSTIDEIINGIEI